MADGGTLAFGLRYLYPLDDGLEDVYNVLKGSDAAVYESMRALEFDSVLYVYYEQEDRKRLAPQGAMVDKLICFDDSYFGETVSDIVEAKGGIPMLQDGGKVYDPSEFEKPS